MDNNTVDFQAEYNEFWGKGYIIVRNAFNKSEMDVLRVNINTNQKMRAHYKMIEKNVENGERSSFSTIFVWNDTSGNDCFSLATRSNKILDRLEYYFKDDVYDYHNKVPLKYPGMIGFPYHQDYGYWYEMGNLYPDMATCFIAIDDSRKENGCLRILESTHKLGRIDHPTLNGIEHERLVEIKKRFKEVYVELDSGDFVIFHCNTLHGSADNCSDKTRLSLIGTYNTKHNDPYEIAHGHPRFQKQEKMYKKITYDTAKNMPDFELMHK